MAKLRIVESTLLGFTGNMGGVVFVDGETPDHVSPLDAARLGASMRVVDADTGEPIGPQYDMIRAYAKRADLTTQATDAVEPRQEDKPDADQSQQEESQASKPEPDLDFTQEQLESIADKGGMKALREFCEPYGVKHVSIKGLIGEMLKLQAQSAQTEPAQE